MLEKVGHLEWASGPLCFLLHPNVRDSIGATCHHAIPIMMVCSPPSPNCETKSTSLICFVRYVVTAMEKTCNMHPTHLNPHQDGQTPAEQQGLMTSQHCPGSQGPATSAPASHTAYTMIQRQVDSEAEWWTHQKPTAQGSPCDTPFV